MLQEFVKAAPEGFQPSERPGASHTYKYYVSGKDCTLGVLFENSVNVYFEWLTERGYPVNYPAAIRYKAWPKREFARLMTKGVWEATELREEGSRLMSDL